MGDLNRNVLSPEGFASLLAQDPDVVNYKSVVHDDLLAGPKSAHQSLYGRWIWQPFHLLKTLFHNGYYKFKSAIMTGQYHFAGEVFYGGTELQPSHVKLLDFLRRRNFTSANKVVWIDYHTGLGNWAEGRSRLQFLGDEEMAHVCTCEYPELWFSTPKKNVLSLMQEFGTFASIRVGASLMMDFYAHHYGDADEKHWAYENVREAFFVRTKFWKQDVMERGLNVMEESLRFFDVNETSLRA